MSHANWIPHPTMLNGLHVQLVPLQETHLEELYIAASDKSLWLNIPFDGSKRDTFFKMYHAALRQMELGNQYPFVIVYLPTSRIIGSTRLFEIYPQDKKIEIGWTFITREFWGTTINLECKLLLLTFCFEILKTVRVQLKTRDINFRSRKAIEKIGAKFEGILRKDKIQQDGSSRNAAYYSILDDEWPEAKQKILLQIKERENLR